MPSTTCLKQDLSIDNTLDLSQFSLDSPFKLRIFLNVVLIRLTNYMVKFANLRTVYFNIKNETTEICILGLRIMVTSAIFRRTSLDQGCGSESGRIRNYLHVRIRIRNLISDPVPDPDPSTVVFQHTVRQQLALKRTDLKNYSVCFFIVKIQMICSSNFN